MGNGKLVPGIDYKKLIKMIEQVIAENKHLKHELKMLRIDHDMEKATAKVKGSRKEREMYAKVIKIRNKQTRMEMETTKSTEEPNAKTT